MSEVLIYEIEAGKVGVDVRLEGETVWLTRDQMAKLFDRDRSVISKHLSNVFRDGELELLATCAKFAQVQTEGGRTVMREIEHYNLDAIISVGYRVKSQRGVQFRQWATRILRDHLVKGVTVNQARIVEQGASEMQAAIELLRRTLESRELVTEAGKDVLSIISRYAKTWRLLLQYDESGLAIPPGCRPARGVFDYGNAKSAISSFKAELMKRGEASDLFGFEREDALAAILGNIEQSMFGEYLYRTREEKAEHLLYFVIKDHPFLDGNKRIGSLLFLLYLEQEGVAARLNENALTALALLIAESNPANKDLLVRLIMNLIISPE